MTTLELNEIPWWILILVIVGFALGRYFVLAGSFYILCYFPGLKSLRKFKIQPKDPTKYQVKRELIYSISTIIVFSSIGLFAYYLYMEGLTTIYLDADRHGYVYLTLSFAGLVLIHDAYFYWTHRLLHVTWLFKKIHFVHHQSFNPTPWAAYAFHPLEALLESLIIIPFVTIWPIHLGVLLLFTFLVLFMNVIGHLGYEFLPKTFRSNSIGRWITSSTHHNLHHQFGRTNFGYYFTFWDWLMVTLNKETTKM